MLVRSSVRAEMDKYWAPDSSFGNRTSRQSSIYRSETTVSGERGRVNFLCEYGTPDSRVFSFPGK